MSTALRTLCGGELMKTWEAELAQLKLRGQKNRMDNIALRESEITEVVDRKWRGLYHRAVARQPARLHRR